MSEHRTITVTVFDSEKCDDWPPESVVQFISWLQAQLDTIPPEYRETATIEIDSESGWEDSHYRHLRVAYLRPETDDEIRKRERHERLERANCEEAERKQYERLRAKYDPTSQ